MRIKIAAVISALCLCGMVTVGQGVPPLPPQSMTKLQSPKGAEFGCGSQMVRLPVAAIVSGPVARIEYFIEPYGIVEADTNLTAVVPMRAWQDLGSMRIEYQATGGKAYEVQTSHWITGPWLAFTRYTAPKSAITTDFYAIKLDEPMRFFRVMSQP